jgi:quercetin dioxygenase-like cupin family protein
MKNKNNTNQINLESFDAPIAAPEQHKVIFENERVRIMDFKVHPGEVVPIHTHRWASINYVVKLSDFLSYDEDGNVKLDTRTEQFGGKEGEAFSLPPYPPLHSVENIGESEMHGISIELKD